MIPEAILLDLGLKDYKETWDLQRSLVEARLADKIPDVLILVEHPHVYTLGRRGDRSNLLTDELPVFQVERGGDVTYHGPGQLVGYPILKLGGPEQDIRNYLTKIEMMLIATVSEFGVKARISELQTGVWVGERKLASIGIAIRSWVTYHGFALNINTGLSYFAKIRPCGLEPSTITSMKEQLGRTVDLTAVKAKLKPQFEEVFHRRLSAGRSEPIIEHLKSELSPPVSLT